MKIQIDEESKKVLTLSEMPIIKKIIKDFKEDGNDLSWELEILMNVFGANEIIKSTASISKNCRACNVFNDESGNIDIWITVTLYNTYSSENGGGVFYMVGAYLSDLWQATADNWEELKGRMHVRKFLETI